MRLQVNVSDDMVTKIDKYAKLMGVSRSALCSMFIGQGILGYDKSYEVLENVSQAYIGDLYAEAVKERVSENFKPLEG